MTILLAVLFIALVFFLPCWWTRIASIPALLKMLPGHGFRGLESYVDPETDPPSCACFWRAAGGVRGVLRHFREMLLKVRILQIQITQEHVSPEQAAEVFHEAYAQFAETLAALPESIFCRTHPHALKAIQTHYALSYRIVTLCGSEDTRPCSYGLTKLL